MPNRFARFLLCLAPLACSGIVFASPAVRKNSHLQIRTSVLEFGAKGDGKTDDTTAIQSALNSGKALSFPAGTFVITSPLTFPAKTNLALNPKTTIFFNCSTPSRGAFMINGASDIHIEGNNGTLQGDKKVRRYGTHIGIMILGASSHVTIDHLTVRDFPDDTGYGGNYGDGIYVGRPMPDGTSPSYVTIERCKCINNSRVQMGTASGTHITFTHNIMTGDATSGVDIEPNIDAEKDVDVKITDNEISGARCGVSISRNSSQILIQGNKIYIPNDVLREPKFPNDYEGIHVDSIGSDITVKDNTVRGGYSGITVTKGKPVVSGNEVIGARIGVWVRYNDITVDHNHIADCWEQGIRVQGDNTKITDNDIEDTGDQTKLFNAKVSEAIGIEIVDGFKNGVLLRNKMADTRPHGESRRIVRLAAADKGGSTWQTDIKP